MSGDRKIAQYVEARRECDALQAQRDALKADELAAWLERWGGDLARARTNTKLAYGALTGGELARAQRALREGT